MGNGPASYRAGKFVWLMTLWDKVSLLFFPHPASLEQLVDFCLERRHGLRAGFKAGRARLVV